jgi:hypothetical protein
MEPLWSPVVATGGNGSQIPRPPERPKQAKTIAVGCDQLPQAAHGKEAVPGSSPGEGLGIRRSTCKSDASVAVHGTDEHLPQKEGLDEGAANRPTRNPLEKAEIGGAQVGMPNLWGQVLGSTGASAVRPHQSSTAFGGSGRTPDQEPPLTRLD